MNASISFEFSPPDLLQGFLTSAICFRDGAEYLSEGGKAPIACAYLVGIALECALKAYLVKKGISEEKLKDNYGHDLEKLWSTARGKGLSIEGPQWLNKLNKVYNSPFHNCR